MDAFTKGSYHFFVVIIFTVSGKNWMAVHESELLPTILCAAG